MDDSEKKGKPKYTPQLPLQDRLFANFKTMVGSDLRSVALFRICLALTVIGDLINRSSDLRAHYTDAGVMPRSLVLSHFQNDLWITLHFMSGLVSFQAVLFLIHGICAFCMLIGYYTKTSTLLTWFMVTSLQNRNLVVLHGGDVLIRVLFFFALFLPLGECYSFDNAYFKPNKSRSKRRTPSYYQIATISTFAISIQIALMYVTSYVHKTGQEWTTIRTATWLALQLDYFRTGMGDFFLNFPELLKFLTASVLWWEGFGVLFWYSPFLTGPMRTFGVLGFFFMHFGFTMCLRLGQFGVTGMTGVLSLLPTWFWEEIVFKRLRTKERLGFKLYYNPTSNLGHRVAIFIENFLLIPESQVLPNNNNNNFDASDLESQQKRDEDLEDSNNYNNDRPARTFNSNSANWFVAQDYRGNTYTDYEALIAICRVSPLLWPLTYVLRKPFIASRLRRWYTKLQSITTSNKSQFITHSPIITVKSPQLQLVLQFWKVFKLVANEIVCLIFLLLILSWNLGNVGSTSFSTPPSVKWVAWALHLDQSWMMFSPRPPSIQWYYNIDARLDNGTNIELWDHEGLFNWEMHPQTWEKPSVMYKNFKNHRWFKYYENGINNSPQNEQLRLNFGRYICREFNSRHHGDERLYQFSIYWMNERAEPDKPRIPQGKQNLWNHICYEKPKT